MCFTNDDGYAEFYRLTNPIARAAHRCDECDRIILRGDKYTRHSGKYDGYMFSTPLLQFLFDSGEGSDANNIAGAWVEDAAGAARQTVIFTDPIPVGADQQGVQFYLVALFTPSMSTDSD